MKNRVTVLHGMLPDLASYLEASGWKLEQPVGRYEVLRARRPGYPRPLLIHDRTCGLDPYSYTKEEWDAYWNRTPSDKEEGT